MNINVPSGEHLGPVTVSTMSASSLFANLFVNGGDMGTQELLEGEVSKYVFKITKLNSISRSDGWCAGHPSCSLTNTKPKINHIRASSI